MTWIRALGVAAGLVGGGVVGEALAERRDRRRFPPPGRFVRVGSRDLHVVIAGAGSPTVVLDATLGAWSSHWELVAAELARHTRVVAYDRAGLGWSEARTSEPRLSQLAGDLSGVVAATCCDDDVVLVGHGLGGLVCRRLAVQEPDRVAGLVVVDGFPEDFGGRLQLPPPLRSEEAGELLHITGLRRLSGWLSSPDRELDSIAALSMQRGVRRTRDLERHCDVRRDDRVALQRRLTIPVRVIASAKPYGRASADAYSRTWFDANEALIEQADDAMFFVARDCDHWVPLRQPESVCGPVEALLRSIRKAD